MKMRKEETESVYCIRCGAKMADEAKYCSDCGNPVNSSRNFNDYADEIKREMEEIDKRLRDFDKAQKCEDANLEERLRELEKEYQEKQVLKRKREEEISGKIISNEEQILEYKKEIDRILCDAEKNAVIESVQRRAEAVDNTVKSEIWSGELKYCPFCGNFVGDFKFCGKCGKQVRGEKDGAK